MRNLLSKSFVVALVLGAAAFAQEGPLQNVQPTGITPEQIIQKFAEKEGQFAQARDHYTYRQSIKIETLDGDTPNGQFQEVDDITYNDQGKRLENVVFAPQPDLQGVSLDPEDLDDIKYRYPFVLTTEELPIYSVMYVGRQQEDELGTYVFDVAPKQMEKGKRYFQGRIWVDDHDFQIVKTSGKPVFVMEKRLQGHQFPSFTTYREQIDGQYWFPTYSISDEVLHFPGSRNSPPNDVHIKIVVKFENYKRFGSSTKIIDNGEEVEKPKDQPPPK
jgi:hypothetical protein